MKRWQCAVGIIGGVAAMAGPALAQDIIEIDGSSTVYPITEAMAEEFQKVNPDELTPREALELLYRLKKL